MQTPVDVEVAKLQKDVKRLTTTINPIAREVLIHPALVLQFVENKFIEELQKNRHHALYLYLANMVDMYPQGFCTKADYIVDSKKMVYEFDRSKFTDVNKYLWGIKAGDYRISPQTTWSQALSKLYNSIYIKLEAKNLSEDNITKFKAMVDESKQSSIVQTKDTLNIPLQLRCISTYKTTSSAKSTLSKYSKTYESILAQVS